MFTGLIETTGTLLRMEIHGADSAMVIQTRHPLEGLTLGESIAVDGACLTVVSFQGNHFAVDVSAETLGRTTLGKKKVGGRLNLERALRMGARLGGHLVTGHVDGIGTLDHRVKEGRSWRLTFRIPEELAHYTIEKGSVAVNGISLTINGCEGDRFDVNIVPHTAQMTTISELQVAEEVNIETDLIGKYVEKMLMSWKVASERSRSGSSVTRELLEKHGFLG